MSFLIDLMSALAEGIPWPVLWIGACLGHAFWATVGLNVLYAWPLPHNLLKFTRKFDVLFILSGPPIFLLALDGLGKRGLEWNEPGVRLLLAPYTLICYFLGVVVAPLCQLRYWMRRPAPQHTATNGTVIDVARELGFPPIGVGKQAPLCLMRGNQVFEVEFNEKTLVLPQLPTAWDGLDILHLSDLHFCGTPDRTFFRYLLDQCLQGGVPDIVALTGDVVDSDWHHRWVVPLLGRLRWREHGWAILGNHDHWRDVSLIRRRLRKVGFRVLVNSWEEILLRGERLAVIGHEGPWQKPDPDLRGCPEGIFRLCLSHSPDTIAWAQKHHIDLMLAGHVHGGQIRFPLIGSTFCPSRYSRRYDCGTFFEPPTVMHVSRGVAGQHPLRIRCRPEVTRLILRTSR